MKKLKRILLDDFEQLSELEAAQCVGGTGIDSNLLGSVPTSTDPFGCDTTNIMVLSGGGPGNSGTGGNGPGNSGTFSGNTSNNGNGTYNGNVYFHHGNYTAGFGYNGKNDSFTFSGSYQYRNLGMGASYNTDSGLTFSGDYKYNNNLGVGASYNSDSGFTFSGKYRYNNVTVVVSHNSSSGFGAIVSYSIKL